MSALIVARDRAPDATNPRGAPSSSPSPVESMTDALETEKRLLDEIIAIMRRQRTAVSADDLQAIDDSVFATHRVLVTLNEARRRRRAINVLFGEREDLPITQLEDVLGDRMTAALGIARDELQMTARALSREVAINRSILRQALASGDAYARVLTGALPDPVYSVRPGPSGPGSPRSQSSNLLDRRG
jgi:hypothetical protein